MVIASGSIVEVEYYVVDSTLRENLQAIKDKIWRQINESWLASAVIEEAMNRGLMYEDDYYDLNDRLS